MIVECPGCKSRYDVSGRAAGSRARCRCGTTFVLPRPSEFARTLNCPQCGAPCAPDRQQCEFCTAVLAVVACVRCFGRLFRGSRHCQHCGTVVDVAARAAKERDEPRDCPRCPSDAEPSLLSAHLVSETLLDECARCGGVWVDAPTFERLVQARDQQAAVSSLGDRPQPAVVERKSDPHPVKYLRCPDCNELMQRVNFGRRSGVVVDVCKPHGIWFDAEELGLAVQYVMRGGLLEAKKKELEDLEREIQRKKTKAASAGGGIYVPNASVGPSRFGGGDWGGDSTFLDVFVDILRRI